MRRSLRRWRETRRAAARSRGAELMAQAAAAAGSNGLWAELDQAQRDAYAEWAGAPRSHREREQRAGDAAHQAAALGRYAYAPVQRGGLLQALVFWA